MDPADAKEIVEDLPLTKQATPKQMLLLIVSIISVGYIGWKLNGAKTEITTAVSQVDSKVDKLDAKVDWLQKSTWSRQDHIEWANELDRLNRKSVPGLEVPTVQFQRTSEPRPQ